MVYGGIGSHMVMERVGGQGLGKGGGREGEVGTEEFPYLGRSCCWLLFIYLLGKTWRRSNSLPPNTKGQGERVLLQCLVDQRGVGVLG
jgi:hypothetical protein